MDPACSYPASERKARGGDFVVNRRFDPIIFALLVISLGTNVYLLRRDHHPGAHDAPLRRGDTVPALGGVSLNGEPTVVRFDSRPVIVYVFSPKCAWSNRNIKNAEGLRRGVAQSHDFVAVPLDESDLLTYLHKNELGWQIIRQVSPEIRRAFRMMATPQTIVVDRGGTVRYVWTGAYTEGIAKEIERTFGVLLPGLQASTPGV
jgi:hypothetical protein